MEDMVMRFDFTPLYRSSVGFDRLFEAFDQQLNSEGSGGWPPYNIERVADDAYRISLVAAGFSPDEIELVQQENELTVTGHRKAMEQATQFLHHGISSRPFKQTFNLAEHVKVVSASQENGLLAIDLKREIPEALKPRRIEISGGANPQTISQNNRAKAEQIGRRDAAA
jgi:molecular chaperone IbpA